MQDADPLVAGALASVQAFIGSNPTFDRVLAWARYINAAHVTPRDALAMAQRLLETPVVQGRDGAWTEALAELDCD